MHRIHDDLRARLKVKPEDDRYMFPREEVSPVTFTFAAASANSGVP